MVLMTMIARVVDGLPLAATMQEEEQVIMYLQNIYVNRNTISTISMSFTSSHIPISVYHVLKIVLTLL